MGEDHKKKKREKLREAEIFVAKVLVGGWVGPGKRRKSWALLGFFFFLILSIALCMGIYVH
jgi:hypothetical protein